MNRLVHATSHIENCILRLCLTICIQRYSICIQSKWQSDFLQQCRMPLAVSKENAFPFGGPHSLSPRSTRDGIHLHVRPEPDYIRLGKYANQCSRRTSPI